MLRCRRNGSAAPRAASAVSADELHAHGVAGTPDEVVERLLAFDAIGAQTMYLQVLDLDDLDHIELLSKEVLPQVY